MQLRSPNELMEAARKEMLDGAQPSTREDWQKVMNFFAANVAAEVQPICLFLLVKVYDIPLTEEEVIEISEFQISQK